MVRTETNVWRANLPRPNTTHLHFDLTLEMLKASCQCDSRDAMGGAGPFVSMDTSIITRWIGKWKPIQLDNYN